MDQNSLEDLRIPLSQADDDEYELDEVECFEQPNETEDEGIENYKIGGYHPTYIGEVMQNRYVIIQKLGWGHFSTVWLAKDFKFETYVALKVQKSAPTFQEAAYDEIEILQTIKRNIQNPRWLSSLSEERGYNVSQSTADDTHLVQLLNVFIHKGPFGNHFVMVFEILGVNLLEVIKKYNYSGIGPTQCKSVIQQVLQGLDYLHRICGVIHTDIKPENILVCLSAEEIKEIVESGQMTQSAKQQQRVKIYQEVHGVNLSSNQNQLTKAQKKLQKKKRQKNKRKILQQQNIILSQDYSDNDTKQRTGKFNVLKVKIADLGSGCWINHHFSNIIQTRPYRAPEVILGHQYGTPADIWSLGCLLFEVVTKEPLFNPRKSPHYNKNDDHLAQMIELLGKFPKYFALSGKNSKKYFDQQGNLKRITEFSYSSMQKLLQEKYKMRESDAQSLSAFVLPMLNIVPQKRPTAKQLLSAPWFNKSNAFYNLVADLDSSSRESDFSEESIEEKSEKRNVDLRAVDRSFTDLGYFGHAEGINCDELDQTSTQFDQFL